MADPKITKIELVQFDHEVQDLGRDRFGFNPVYEKGTVWKSRLGILKMLTTGPKNVTALCKGVGQKQPTISHHLGLLKMGRLVTGTRKGKSVIYVCDAAAMKALAVGLAKLTPRK